MARSCHPAYILSSLLLVWGPGCNAAGPPPSQAPSMMHTATRNTPRIGLVLSGGGARGIAEIGVLKELERLRIPVHCVTGTSMGAIVGGFYASGMSPEEIEKTLLSVDWADSFSDRPPRRYLPYRRKQDDRRYLSGFEVGISKDRAHLASGMTSGLRFLAILNEAVPSAARTVEFDALPIPFRCVATDLETGEEVVLERGMLSMAIRASASFPAVLSPVELEGRLLVDGGISNNLPVDLARTLGADIVIAVDVGTPPVTRSALTSPLAVTSQVVSILSQKRVDEQAARADILIRPQLEGHSSMDFTRLAPLVEVGAAATRQASSALLAWALNESDYAAYRAAVEAKREGSPRVDFIAFEGTSPEDEARLRGAMRTTIGAPLDPKQLRYDLLRLYNTGDYTFMTHTILEEEGRTGVKILATPNPLGNIRLRGGVRFSTDFEDHSDWGVLAGLRWSGLNAAGGEWKSDLDMGLNSNGATEFYQPFAYGSPWFIAPSLTFSSELQDRYEGDWNRARYRATKVWAGLDLGLRLGQYGEVRVGPAWGHAWYRHSVGDAFTSTLSQQIAGVRLQVAVDRLDSADLPSRGYLLETSAFFSSRELGAREKYQEAEVKWSGFLPVGSDTLLASLSFGTALGSDLPPYEWFRLGGIDSFAGYQPGQLVGPYYVVARLGYMRRLADWPTLIGRGVYLVLLADGGNVGQTTDAVDLQYFRYSGTLAIGTSTRFGLMYLGLSQTEGGNCQATLSLGKRF